MTTFQEAFQAAETEIEGNEDAATALDEGTDVVGQAAGEGTDSEVGDESVDFDLDQYGSQTVTIKVDGVDTRVPVSELRNGYMRQSDYTQKTQVIAAERARLHAAETLAAAYERNPQETIRFLAQQNGLTFAEAKAQAEAAGDEQTEGWANNEYTDPRIEALEQRLAQFDQRDAVTELDAKLARLGNLYGEDFVPDEVVNRAIALGTTDLEGVYKQGAFDRMFARKGAEQEVAQRTAAETAQRTAAKASLSSTVASGGSFAGAGSTGSAPITSVAQALAAAQAEHGWADDDF